ncbi:4-alpha-glucanotransferase [Rubrivirga marina]|uniref:4-alpha-glucanotransferase n=1 Tax=Rubrivirga marina TaxID=1196024 RepID=A0A271IW24_9BACT|nr:4-alpha-glucanotransferase [Rubrivirga marina]PAP74994.1 4-alpha-glucanotransferase [Rubrivirga marina]
MSAAPVPRSSGLLLHVTSLPSRYGIGDLGDGADRFVRFLAQAGQRVWQVLPLVPTGLGDSPYASPSTFALNPLLVSPDRLVADGLLTADDLEDVPAFPEDQVDFAAVASFKDALIAAVFDRFRADEAHRLRPAFDAFVAREVAWLDDYALFVALKDVSDGAAWADWPAPLARRDPDALAAARHDHAEAVDRVRFVQFVLDRQWAAVRARCREAGVEVLGDLPIYVALDSADVWADRDLFDLDADGRPTAVAGVPPDYFSETGQLWGNPLYRWDRMRERDYAWWRRRLRRTLDLVDRVRLDHFRGFEAYWSVPASEETAVDGRWVDGPRDALFEALADEVGRPLPIVAEDLGLITDEVRELMARFDLPGMAVLQFAFGGDPDNPYLPHHHRRHLVAYTGTHDNDTTAGWWASASPDEREFAGRYLGLDVSTEEVHRAALRSAWASVADLAVAPMQDVLGLGSEARMNTPGEGAGNWGWRMTDAQLAEAPSRWLRSLTATYGRLPKDR